ncbi:MAG: protein translocase subunit SecD, partial [Pseudomonadota bacterium]
MAWKFLWRVLIVVAAVLWAVIYIIPTLATNLPASWSKVFPSDKISLGLDLRGGMHLILEVQAEKAVDSAMERTVEELKFELRKEKIALYKLNKTAGGKIELEIRSPDDLDRTDKLLSSRFEYLATDSTTKKEGRVQLLLSMHPREAKRIKEMAVRQALETIRNRVDEFGVAEPEIRPQGEDRITIQLPGIKDPKRAVALIGKTALLEFKLVAEETSPEEALKNGPPPGTEIAYQIVTDPDTGRITKKPYLLEKRTLMTGQYVTDARRSIDNQFNAPYVSLNLDAKGARLFERITETNVKRRLAIVLDGNVYSAPVIQEKIPSGRAQITGSFTLNEAQDLAIVLRAGALPAPVRILEERTVGPSLGADSIRQGLYSALIGLILVLLFMGIYYRLSGIIADVALLLNILLIMGAMAAFRATLTLPGIAGIILTIGMSVDANVLIFERIREEIRLGKSARAAVSGGFSKAFLTIL